MGDDQPFIIAKDNLDTGLRGYPIGYCITSHVFPEEGVYYRQYPIREVVYKEVEEVMFLLIEGKLPSSDQLKTFKQELWAYSTVSEKVKKAILKLPRKGHPMKMYAMAILLLGVHESQNDIKKDFKNLLAKLPELTAIVINHRAGWGKTPISKPQLGVAANFCQMMLCPSITDKKLFKKFITLFINLHMDHGGGNLSAFTAKAVASGREDLYGSIAAGMLALSGDRHGRANEAGLAFVKKVYKNLGNEPSADAMSNYLKTLIEGKQVIYGFGHSALRCCDPRSTELFEFAEKYFPKNPLLNTASLLKKVAPPLLKAGQNIASPESNIDSISGVVLFALGFDFPEYFTVLFGMSRIAGIGRQIIYETLEARDGKGVPIYRPRYIYKNM